ncbi:MAG: endonuclease domain-containing protein [Polymorphobacter sp.]
MIAIEIDGRDHGALSRRANDIKKVSLLELLGWRVLRFSNGEVLNNLNGCVLAVSSIT